MALQPGARLGQYEVLSALGAGGMGEVWRARDTRLDREVALKVLPEAFTSDPERLARFEREAKVLASLDHPSIGGIYGLEEADGVKALVLELVEGPTLADRIAQGPIPVDEALPISRQIAEALEVAHERGIIHRDLKPANVKVRPDGTVKVLDFGLAKILQPDAGDPNLSQSPTLSLSAAATRMGVILGTAPYMAPEQARGRTVDKRADIWAFGCVLYEVLTGVRAFEAEDTAKTLAKILERPPDWSLLPRETPVAIRRLLERCLDKDPRNRLRDIGEARVAVEAARAEGPAERPRPRWSGARVLLFVAAAALLATVAASYVTSRMFRATARPAPRPTARWTVSPPTGRTLSPGRFYQSLTFSPDGRQLVFTAAPAGEELAIEEGPQLFVRELASLDLRPLAGTEGTSGLGTGAASAFFSPDGRWLGFFADRKLKKIALEGGAPLVVCESCSVYAWGAVWLPDDTIVLGDTQEGVGLQRVPAAGGAATQLTTLADGEVYHRWPTLLPDGRSLLFVVVDDGGERLEVVDLETGRRRQVEGIAEASRPRYVETGHLLYTYGRELWAAPFDPRTLTVGTGATRIHEFDYFSATTSSPFAVSSSGTLAYVAASGPPPRRLVWVDRAGRSEDFGVQPEHFWNPRLSPDGRHLAVDAEKDGKLDIWIYEVATGRSRRLTSNGRSCYPHWMPDGRIGFAVRPDWAPEPLWGVLTALALDGPQQSPQVLSPHPYGAPGSWTSDDRLLFATWGDDDTGFDLWTITLDGAAEPWLATAYHESQPELSPDGRWSAYSSSETGEWEIFVASFSDGQVKRRVSAGGGLAPIWSADGREIFYREGSRLMAVAWNERAASVPRPAPLFPDPYWMGTVTHMERTYDVAPDGRFLMLESVEDEAAEPALIVVVENFFGELKRLVPTR